MECSRLVVVSHSVKNIEKLLNKVYPERDSDINNELTVLKIELDKDLAVRCHAAKEGLYGLLVKCLRHLKDKYLLAALQTLTSLCNGNTNVLDTSGAEYMIA
ncbi:hypothetical protein Phum_PHUM388670 [Pediculus humanus corporis]|uniref:Uncharacterized protein n=1 Tax=Pediculus humanus subsp. corporis TaxID=121224 RepID=E0VQX6_PEDHC|nr:uncharacterized protein Phum_PHUM388670 [Pediculus humanus corporis]EEB15782.1 hypothetical protein Phum_PHUM388670 [Pediculus humanus corporis]